MNILVDTSVWSLLLHRKKKSSHPAAKKLHQLIDEGGPLCITGVIFQEVLQGIRSETQFHQIRKYLLDFPFLETTPVIHEEAAQLFNRCRKKGIQSHTIDCLIAALSLHYKCSLLTTDKDFQCIAHHFPLKLFL